MHTVCSRPHHDQDIFNVHAYTCIFLHIHVIKISRIKFTEFTMEIYYDLILLFIYEMTKY